MSDKQILYIQYIFSSRSSDSSFNVKSDNANIICDLLIKFTYKIIFSLLVFYCKFTIFVSISYKVIEFSIYWFSSFVIPLESIIINVFMNHFNQVYSMIDIYFIAPKISGCKDLSLIVINLFPVIMQFAFTIVFCLFLIYYGINNWKHMA